MALYKILDCKNYQDINREILDYILDKNIDSSDDFWNPVDAKKLLKKCPLFAEWLKINRILIQAVSVTVAKHKNCCGPHIDTPPARYKLSWPVLNTKNTFNRWFKIKDSNKYILNKLGGKSYQIDNLIEIACNEVLNPMIIDAGVIHDVLITDNKFPRLGLQCQLLKEPKLL